VIELAPPAVETPLLRGEFAQEMKDQKGMDVKVLANRAISGVEAGKLEIRPGLSNVLKVMSRIAPQFMLDGGCGRQFSPPGTRCDPTVLGYVRDSRLWDFAFNSII
jgi:hypothetical protein